MTGLIVLALALLAATAFGVWRQRVDGRLRPFDRRQGRGRRWQGRGPGRRQGHVSDGPGQVRVVGPVDEAVTLTSAELGDDLGARATLVQFSSAFCAPCRAARQVLARTAGQLEGVRHVEVDAETHLELVRRLGITKTPTTFVLDAQGRIVRRATGVPRMSDVKVAVDMLDAG